MMTRALTNDDGRVRLRRVLALLVVTGALALASIPLIFVAPALGGAALAFSLTMTIGAKVPLIALLWWLMMYSLRRERAAGVVDRTQGEDILAALRAQMLDPAASHRNIAAHAWWLADTCEDEGVRLSAIELALAAAEAEYQRF